jgi:DNA glycosylase AlkZ-like
MISLSDNQVRLLRTRAQLLAAPPGGDTSVAEVVEWVCGIQAQDYDAACLSVRVRSRELKMSDVERAQGQERSVVRTWAFRGTLHLIAATDLLWLLPLLGPHFARADARRRMELGLDEATCARGMSEIRRLLHAKGPLSRSDIAEHLSAKGIPTDG